MSNSGINWAKLYSQDRVNIPGVPWNNEELDAIHKLKIPAKFVRKGILTLEDYEKTRKEGAEEPLPIEESKEKLLERAEELGIDATPDTREDDLIRLIENAQKKLDEKEPEEGEEIKEEPEEEIEEEVKEEKLEVKKVKKTKK